MPKTHELRPSTADFFLYTSSSSYFDKSGIYIQCKQGNWNQKHSGKYLNALREHKTNLNATAREQKLKFSV